MTEQRRVIKEIITQSPEHLSADAIYMQARERLPAIAVGTVYRNLGLMVDAGEIRRIPVPNAPDRYDKNVMPHEHMLCGRCGHMVDIHVGDLKGYLAKQSGMCVSSYDLAVVGICADCAE